MPWRGPSYEGEFPSLGWDLIDWFERYFRVPDGPLAGEPLRLTDEQADIVVRWYALDDRHRWLFRRGAVRRPQGWGKSPMLGLIALGELCGPTVFDGWDANGDPVGRPQPAPWVQVAALSEDQADNTYAAIHAMSAESELSGSVLDVGITRIYLRDGVGRLEPVTSAAGTRLGQRVTFAVLDETHLWTKRTGGHKLAATIRRNAGKMNGRTFESTNAHLPGEFSVAELTFDAHQKGAPGLLYDARVGVEVESLEDAGAVRRALDAAYGGSRAFVDLDRIAAEIADPGTDPTDARRFYLNQLVAGIDQFVDIQLWDRLAAPRVVEPGERVGLGFDGSISDDLTVLRGCTADGFTFTVGAWERPANAPAGWLVPRAEVHATLREAFARWDVGLLVCDPPKWWTEIEAWGAEFGDDRVEVLDTNSARRFAPLCDRYAVAVREGSLSHDGSSRLRAHLAASSRKPVRLADDLTDGRSPFVITKMDTRKIDEAVAEVLAFYAAETMDAAEVPVEVGARWL